MTIRAEGIPIDTELDVSPYVLDLVNQPVDTPEQRRKHLTHSSFGQIAACRLVECPYFYDTRTDDHYNDCAEKVVPATELNN